jgi:SAM-dependent methyltransferase
VRSRKALLAARLDHVAERVRSPHVLSVACGHLREAGESAAFRRNAFGRLVALDQDPQSLEVVRASLPGTGVETLCGSIKLLLAGAFADQRFDYIYAAGLFDYLDDKLARRVTESMFQLLRPGGTLLVANYLKDIADVGYMEVYMDWRLLYRSLDELLSLSDGIRAAEVASRSCFQDATGNVGYLELARA